MYEQSELNFLNPYNIAKELHCLKTGGANEF